MQIRTKEMSRLSICKRHGVSILLFITLEVSKNEIRVLGYSFNT